MPAPSTRNIIPLLPTSGGTTDVISVATTGTSAPAFKVGRKRPIVFAVTGHAAPAFSAGRKHPITFAVTGHAAPAFTIQRRRARTVAATGKSTPGFQVFVPTNSGQRDDHLSVAINKLHIY